MHVTDEIDKCVLHALQQEYKHTHIIAVLPMK